MSELITHPNVVGQDDFYSELLAAHSNCDSATREAINTRLILLLANHIGDREVLSQALAIASKIQAPNNK